MIGCSYLCIWENLHSNLYAALARCRKRAGFNGSSRLVLLLIMNKAVVHSYTCTFVPKYRYVTGQIWFQVKFF